MSAINLTLGPYTDAAAREAQSGLTDANIGDLALQEDTGAIWAVTAVSGGTATWAQQGIANLTFDQGAASTGDTDPNTYNFCLIASTPTLWSAFNSGGGGGSGTVTSVSLTVPSWLTNSTPTITSSGTFAITATTGETANLFLATPNGTTGGVSLRAIVAADIPSLAASIITSGELALARGGTSADLSATGGTGEYLKQATSGGAITVGTIPSADIPPIPTFPTYSGSVAYVLGNIVVGSDTNYYRATASTTGHDPTTDNATYWELHQLNVNTTLNVGSSARFTTLASALAFAQNCFVGSEYTGGISIADGMYTIASTVQINLACGSRWTIQGNPATPANVVLNWTGSDSVMLQVSSDINISGLSLVLDGGNMTSALRCSVAAKIIVSNTVINGLTNGVLADSPGAVISLPTAVTVKNCTQGVSVLNGGHVYASGVTYTSNTSNTNIALDTQQVDGSLISSGATGAITGTGISALTGDGTASGTGSVALTLATVNSTTGVFGDASHTTTTTTNGKGLITSIVANAIAIAASQITSGQLTLARGGTGADLSATGGTGEYVKQVTSGGTLTVATIAAADLPLGSSSAFGAVKVDGITIKATAGVISAGSIASVTYTSTSLADDASDTSQTITVGIVGMSISVSASVPSRVRAYTNFANLTADISRSTSTLPTPGTGVVFDVVFVSATTQYFEPLAGYANQDGTRSSLLYLNIENMSGSTSDVTGAVEFVRTV